MENILKEIRDSIINIEIGKVHGLVRKALKENISANEIFMESICKGMDVVGQKYEACEYFLTELLGASQVVNNVLEKLGPQLQNEPIQPIGKVVIGTVKGDIHDIGKNIVKMLMNFAGFDVHDLGTDIPSKRFVEKIRDTNTDILAMSSLLTTTMGEIKMVIEELEKVGLRKKLKVIIGGAPITDEFAREVGADAAAKDAAHGVRICKEWIGRTN